MDLGQSPPFLEPDSFSRVLGTLLPDTCLQTQPFSSAMMALIGSLLATADMDADVTGAGFDCGRLFRSYFRVHIKYPIEEGKAFICFSGDFTIRYRYVSGFRHTLVMLKLNLHIIEKKNAHDMVSNNASQPFPLSSRL